MAPETPSGKPDGSPPVPDEVEPAMAGDGAPAPASEDRPPAAPEPQEPRADEAAPERRGGEAAVADSETAVDDVPPTGPEAAAEPERARPPPEIPAPRPAVRRHHYIVRLTHWVNTVVLIGMVASGLQIYNAYERFGIRGARLPLPNPLDMHPVPQWARLGGWLAGGLNWHFFLMWPLVLNGLLYLGYLVISGEWRSLLFRPRDVGAAVEMQKYYLHLRREHPPQGKHNALQKAAYSFIMVLGMLSVASGLALWKPVRLPWLTAAFGGYELARYWHFVAVWLFLGFIVVHVVLVFAVDPASLCAMITGWYRGRFPSHD
jgi:thiosulfate reductase cytochrome b subunit